METSRILVIDDEPVVCKSVKKILERKGHSVDMAHRGKDGLDLIDRNNYDILIVDLKMPGVDGLEVLKLVRESHPSIPVLMITGFASVENAVESMKLGAFDYIQKPFSPDELVLTVEKALETRRLKNENILLKKRLKGEDKFPGIIGNSKKMLDVFDLVEKVATTSATVLITGESGTGKELVARAIHNLSKRSDKRFVAVDCGAFSSELMKSELFGHMKGSFTGAVSSKKGLLEIAHGGTIFFDEISNMDLEIQSKILRVLQEREFVPIGGTEPRRVNVRVISATNQDLKKMVGEGKFREDLFYRIYVVPIRVPPLRERKEDIPSLVYYFLQKYSPDKKDHAGISSDALKRLIDYEWPGNVRQLENKIQRALILSVGKRIEIEHLPIVTRRKTAVDIQDIPETNEELKRLKKLYRKDAIEWLEKNFILQALNRNDWNVTLSAESVGMQRSNFHALMKKYSIRKK
jgi:DNA-binding NtrC family response regulator